MSSIRLGVIGLDHWYNAYPVLDGFRHLGAEISIISHSNDAELRAAAARYGADAASSFLEVVGEPEVDAVCIFATTDAMASASIAALVAGKAVIANKPAAMDLQEAQAIIYAQEASGRPFFGFDSARRWSPPMRAIYELASRGDLGELRHIALTIHAPEPRGCEDSEGPGWFADPMHTPGGAFIDHGIYHADLVRWFAGEEVGFVQASIARLGDPNHPFEDYGQATLATANSLVATIEDTWTAIPGGFRDTIELTGTLGTARYDSADGRTLVRLAGDLPGWRELPVEGTRGEYLRHILAVLQDEEEPAVTAFDARQNLAICLAAYQSANTGLSATPQ